MCIQVKNSLKLFPYNLCNSLQDDKLRDKFDLVDKMLDNMVHKTIMWLDASQEASEEE